MRILLHCYLRRSLCSCAAQEVEFERVLGRKARVDRDALQMAGFAGDLTDTFVSLKRTEDHPDYFKR